MKLRYWCLVYLHWHTSWGISLLKVSKFTIRAMKICLSFSIIKVYRSVFIPIKITSAMASDFPDKTSNFTFSMSNGTLANQRILQNKSNNKLIFRIVFSFHYSESTQLCSQTLSDVTWSYDASLTLLPAWWLFVPHSIGWRKKIELIFTEACNISNISILLQMVHKVAGFWNEDVSLHQFWWRSLESISPAIKQHHCPAAYVLTEGG